MARLMLSAGMFAALALSTTVRRRGLASGSPPPMRAAIVISRMSLVKSLPRLASSAPFLCLIVCHLECPDMALLLRGALARSLPPALGRADQQKSPGPADRGLSVEYEEKSRQRPTLPPGHPDSTIGAGGLNGRVRNGNGCDPSAMVTGMNLSSRRQPKILTWREGYVVHDYGFGQCKHHGQASRPISTRKLRALQLLHIGPINLVVYKGSLGRLPCGRHHLEAGFTLRCFQRLSQPNLATQLCLWRDNWCTRGSSIPVLSY